MSSTGYNENSWSTEELERRVKLYQTPKGHFDPTKIYVSTMADVAFVGALILAALIFVAEFFIFLALGKVWTSEHFVAMGMFEIYPLIFAGLIGLYVFGHRYDETVKYYQYKKALRARKQSEVSHGEVKKFA